MASRSASQNPSHGADLRKLNLDVTPTRIFLLSTIPAIITLLLLQSLTSRYNPFRIPLFDASSTLLGARDDATLRWDAIHFLSIATKGYEFEQQLAFQPGWQGVLHLTGRISGFATGGKDLTSAIVPGSRVVMILLAGWRGTTLYKLTAYISNKRTAYLTTVLYLFVPTPAVLVSPYTEPLYACLTFTGFHQVFQRRYAIAAIFLGGATSIRATGAFVAPILAAMAIFREGNKAVSTKTFISRAMAAAVPCIVVVIPLLAFQGYAYLSFCVPEPTRPWCQYRLPIAYSYVQAEYWYVLFYQNGRWVLKGRNIGFLNFWTMDQVPNLLIALPVLAVSITGVYRYLSSDSSLPKCITPLVLHHAAMTALLVFGSHTQIALRVVSTDPVFWWLLSDIAFPRGERGMSTMGKIWMWWSVTWGAVSIVLWAGHYPPA